MKFGRCVARYAVRALCPSPLSPSLLCPGDLREHAQTVLTLAPVPKSLKTSRPGLSFLSQVMLAQGHILLMGTWVHPRSVEGRDSGAWAQLWLCQVLLCLRRQVGTACRVQRQGLAAQTHCKQWCSPPRSGNWSTGQPAGSERIFSQRMLGAKLTWGAPMAAVCREGGGTC